MILFRPVGLKEMQLIYETGLRAFPPRLPQQPIFYPVLNQEYATQIARDWNTKSNTFAGYVTRFELGDEYAQRFERRIVGSRVHEELWVQAEELPEFNRNITGIITVVDAYFGPQFRGYIPSQYIMENADAVQQFLLLSAAFDCSRTDVYGEIQANNLAVFLHYPYWLSHDFREQGLHSQMREQVLAAIREVWAEAFPSMPLPAIAKRENDF